MNLVALTPTDDRIVVRKLPDEPANVRVFITDLATNAHYGEVLVCGPGRRMREGDPAKLLYRDGRRRPMCVKPGDRVVYGRYTDFDGEGIVMIREADVIGIVRDAA